MHRLKENSLPRLSSEGQQAGLVILEPSFRNYSLRNFWALCTTSSKVAGFKYMHIMFETQLSNSL